VRKPRDAGLYFNRGISHGSVGATERALADYTEAIAKQPDLAVAYHNRGEEFERIGSLTEARADFERALELPPNLAASRQALDRIGAR